MKQTKTRRRRINHLARERGEKAGKKKKGNLNNANSQIILHVNYKSLISQKHYIAKIWLRPYLGHDVENVIFFFGFQGCKKNTFKNR